MSDEAAAIRDRIDDLEILLETLQHTSETLAVFLRPHAGLAEKRKKLAENTN